MALALQSEPTPLHADEHGVVHVGGTRVTLDQVLGAFRTGVTPEEIAMRYDTLDLADVELIRVQAVGLAGTPGPQILEWAAKEGRILLRTMSTR